MDDTSCWVFFTYFLAPKSDERDRNGWQMGGYMTSAGLIMIILFTLVYIVILRYKKLCNFIVTD